MEYGTFSPGSSPATAQAQSLFSPTDSFTTRFRSVVAAQPDALAFVCAEASWTFAEADRASDALALALALEPGQDRSQAPVATLMEQSSRGLIAILGVLKSGRPIVALDPQVPPARLAQILELAGASTCVSSARYAAIRGELDGVRHWVDLDAALATPLPSVAAASPLLGRDDVAVLIFTSGSTGAPKGVVWTHQLLLNESLSSAEQLGFCPGDRVGLVFPVSFAAGFIVLIFAVLNGATSYPYDPRVLGIAGMPDWINANRLTVLPMTPSLLRALTAARQGSLLLRDLRMVATAGEAIYSGDIAAARPMLPPTCVYTNWSGASEIGLQAVFPIPSDAALPERTVPVGFAANRKQIVILRDDGTPAEVGETGEIVMKSLYCATGYWRAPEATAARFSREPDGRICYRTGDLGRLDASGALTLLGRRDAAVKVRGYLVEPSEIEAALLASGAVSEAVVIAELNPPAPTRLVAYVVPDKRAKTISAAALRGLLRRKLPSYMVPATIVWMPALPRNERGKVDRPALPPPKNSEAPFAPPFLEWELVLADLWMHVLHLEDIGVNDDFVELGGDSLAAEQLLRSVSETFGIELPSNTLVEAPTLAEFARKVENSERRTQSHPTTIPLRTGGTRPPLFCFAGAGGLAFGFLSFARQFGADQPIYAFQSHGLEHRAIPDWSIQRTARRHLQMMRVLCPRGPYFLAGHSLGGIIAMEIAHQLRASGEEVALLVLLDTYLPERAPGFVAHPAARATPTFGAPPLEPTTTTLPPARPREDVVATTDASSSWRQLTRDVLSEVGYTLRRRMRLRSFLRMVQTPLAGIVPFEGALQYETFFTQGRVMQRFYSPRPWEGRTIVWRAQDNPEPSDSWSPLLPGGYQSFSLPCEHFSILREPHVIEIAAHVALEIDTILAAVGHPSARPEADLSSSAAE